MKVYAITGGSGSGKSTACLHFLSFGIQTIDADVIYHEITSAPSECVCALQAEFGDGILAENGGLDRKKLREIVFAPDITEQNRKRKLGELNSITHAFVLAKIRDEIAKLKNAGCKIVLVDIPLLYESGFDSECDGVICVVADVEKRVARICERDGISPEQAHARISAQMTDEERIKRSDFVIQNDNDEDKLHEIISDVVRKL